MLRCTVFKWAVVMSCGHPFRPLKQTAILLFLCIIPHTRFCFLFYLLLYYHFFYRTYLLIAICHLCRWVSKQNNFTQVYYEWRQVHLWFMLHPQAGSHVAVERQIPASRGCFAESNPVRPIQHMCMKKPHDELLISDLSQWEPGYFSPLC